MKMTVKRKYLLDLLPIFANAGNIFGGSIPSKVRYAFSVNMKRCSEEAKEIEEGFPNDPKWVEYEKGRIQMVHEAGINSNEDISKLSAEQLNALDERIKVYAEPFE